MTHIYDNNLNYILTLNYNFEEFKTEPKKYFPDWKNSYYASEQKYEHPIITEGQIREMTREEKILNLSMLELLQDGEYIENGEILIVECPENILRKAWNKKKSYLV